MRTAVLAPSLAPVGMGVSGQVDSRPLSGATRVYVGLASVVIVPVRRSPAKADLALKVERIRS